MLSQTKISKAIDDQRAGFTKSMMGFVREELTSVPMADSFATIITGLRRSGKSTLLLQLLHRNHEQALCLNFDDIRLSAFETDDFVRLHKEVVDRGIRVLFFDEIQNVAGWEIFVSQLLREGYKVFVTGSNASMLSLELGTRLTGRHLSMELFPFSFSEFSTFTGRSAEDYLVTGGIPEYVKTEMHSILRGMLDDILIRDIAVRHAVRDVSSLRQLAVYLLTNIGNLVSANKLAGMFGIKAASTFLEYFSYLHDSYLFDFVPQFSHSLKAQARNPKKVYTIDLGFYSAAASSTSENLGRRFENMIYMHLRRSSKEIFYHKDRGECDFVVQEKGRIVQAVQACHTIDDENFDREYDGLAAAMRTFELTEGTIATMNQSDTFERGGLTIRLVPAAEFMLGKPNS